MDDVSMEQTMEDMPEDFSMVPPLQCADCGKPVYLEIEQEYTKSRYGRVLCRDCEEAQDFKNELIGILEAAGYGD